MGLKLLNEPSNMCMRQTIYFQLYLLISFFSFSGSIVYAQSSIALPDMAIPSPQAGEITKFGNLPVDESTGRISATIPIHTYTAGSLQVPISLSYSGGGVKVEQRPTWTGINWILNAGGVITRMVKDLPDETNKPRLFYSYEELEELRDSYEQWSNTTPSYLINSGIKLPDSLSFALSTDDYRDSEVDIFNFSFPGHSGSFYLEKDENGTWRGKLLKYDSELKIEVLDDFSEFGEYEIRIITPDATSYYFGGMTAFSGATEIPSRATEETQLVDRSGGPLNVGKRAKTAFYLTMIESYTGDRVFFEYHTKDEYDVFSATSGYLDEVLYTSREYGVGTSIVNCSQLSLTGVVDPHIVRNVVYNGKFLKRMWSNVTGGNPLNYDIVFESFEATANIGANNPQQMKFRVLSSIDYSKGSAELEYIPSKTQLQQSSSREKFFLTDVKNLSINNNAVQKYQMEYNDPLGLPATTLSNSQDLLGYFNGKTNPSLLPKNSLTSLMDHLGSVFGPSNGPSTFSAVANFTGYESQLGDRTSSFQHATKGILKKIKYPTGGSTEFFYEPIVRDKQIKATKGLAAFRNKLYNPQDQLVGYTGIGCLPILILDEAVDTTSVFMTQNIIMNLGIDVENRNIVTEGDYVEIIQRDCQGVQISRKQWDFPANGVDQYLITHFDTTMEFTITKGQRCTFEIRWGSGTHGQLADNPNTYIEVGASFEYVVGYDPDEGSGIRIKKIIDYANDSALNSPAQTRRFYYKTLKDVVTGKSDSFKKLYTPLFHSLKHTLLSCQDNNSNTSETIYVTLISLGSNSFTNNLFGEVWGMFPVVTTSIGGDNFEGGGIEKHYRTVPDDRMQNFNSPETASGTSQILDKTFEILNDSRITNRSEFNGTLVKESSWRKTGNTLHKISSTDYTYNVSVVDRANNVYSKKIAEADMQFIIQNLFFGTYATNSNKVQSVGTITKKFVDGVPITTYTIPPPPPNLSDIDNDSIPNSIDPDFEGYPDIVPFEEMTDEMLEAPFRRVTTTSHTYYYANRALVFKEDKDESDGAISQTKYYYPVDTQLNGLNIPSYDLGAYESLTNCNRIGNPIQTEYYKNSQRLGTTRDVYSNKSVAIQLPGPDSTVNRALLAKVQTSKANNDFEDRVIYHEYDQWGNPAEVSLANGAHVVYIWNSKRQLRYKIVNATLSQSLSALQSGGEASDPENAPPPVANPFVATMPAAHVYMYAYDPLTNDLVSITDPKGDKITYEYDEFNRLKTVKDRYGNVLNEYEYHYRTQTQP